MVNIYLHFVLYLGILKATMNSSLYIIASRLTSMTKCSHENYWDSPWAPSFSSLDLLHALSQPLDFLRDNDFHLNYLLLCLINRGSIHDLTMTLSSSHVYSSSLYHSLKILILHDLTDKPIHDNLGSSDELHVGHILFLRWTLSQSYLINSWKSIPFLLIDHNSCIYSTQWSWFITWFWFTHPWIHLISFMHHM